MRLIINIKNVGSLQRLTGLRQLHLRNNEIALQQPLLDLSQLESLNIKYNVPLSCESVKELLAVFGTDVVQFEDCDGDPWHSISIFHRYTIALVGHATD
ncbi:hypothetical protein NSMM_180021 [Nitrosomonas mobilis]|uniref:Uncharacterized protein n=1 Tax=Nitrosomonas mobilis TaxID=51642 RepID=A0A1G5SB92_9PROT|nr:hypothetical protein NSMM_180021 [Nitrosomonas mobilis]